MSEGAEALRELLGKVDHVWDEKRTAEVRAGFCGVQNLRIGVLLPVPGRGELGDERENLGIEIMWQSLGFASEFRNFWESWCRQAVGSLSVGSSLAVFDTN